MDGMHRHRCYVGSLGRRICSSTCQHGVWCVCVAGTPDARRGRPRAERLRFHPWPLATSRGGLPHDIAFSRPARGYGTGWETWFEVGRGTSMVCGSPFMSKTPLPCFGTQPPLCTSNSHMAACARVDLHSRACACVLARTCA